MRRTETLNMFHPKTLQLTASLLLLFLISGCQTPPTAPPMPPSQEQGDIAESPEEVVTPALPDHTLLAGDHQISLAELREGKIDTKWVITVITDPASVEYSRTLELLDEISGLGYRVRYQPPSATP